MTAHYHKVFDNEQRNQAYIFKPAWSVFAICSMASGHGGTNGWALVSLNSFERKMRTGYCKNIIYI